MMTSCVLWTRAFAVWTAVVFLQTFPSWSAGPESRWTLSDAGLDPQSALTTEQAYYQSDDTSIASAPDADGVNQDQPHPTMSWEDVTSEGSPTPPTRASDEAPYKTQGMRIAIMPINVGLAAVPREMLKELYRTMDCAPSPGYETCAVGY
jgi:hypothetical protein